MKASANMVPDQINNIAGSEFKVVDEFVHLGLLIRTNGESTSEIKRNIMAESRFCYGLLRQLRSKLLTKQTNFKIYRMLVRPVLN